MKKKILSFFYLFILLQPFINLITSLMTKFLNIEFTLGVLIKGIVFIISLVYVLFISKSKYKKYSKIYLFVILLYCICYFLTKRNIFSNFTLLYTEINYLFKYFYTLIVLLGLLNFFDEYKPNNRKIFKILQINLFLYCFIIFLANITGTAFATYGERGLGNIGWFYSGNEISVTIALLFPLIYLLVNKTNSYKLLIYIIPIVIGIEYIGTKTSMLGLILPTIVSLIYYLIRFKSGKQKQFFITLIILGVIALSYPYLPIVNNIKDNINKFNERMQMDDVDEDYTDSVADNIIFSSRDYYERKVSKIYKNNPIQNKIFGIGFTDSSKSTDGNIEKLIEMDFHDIFYHYGILGLIIYIIPFICITIYVLRRIIIMKLKLNEKQLILTYISYIGLAISAISGHVLGSPSVATYLDLIIILMLYYYKYEYYRINIDENRITILVDSLKNIKEKEYLLQLFSILNKYYDIDLVITNDSLKGKFDNEINVKYLIKNKSNKLLKYLKTTLYIEEVNSKYIITSDFNNSVLVGRNKNRDTAAIYLDFNNNEQYIDKIVSFCDNIKYLIVIDRETEKKYKEKLINNKTECIYIQNNKKDYSKWLKIIK